MTAPIGLVPWVAENYFEIKVSFGRIMKILNDEEISYEHTDYSDNYNKSGIAVKLQNVIASFP